MMKIDLVMDEVERIVDRARQALPLIERAMAFADVVQDDPALFALVERDARTLDRVFGMLAEEALAYVVAEGAGSADSVALLGKKNTSAAARLTIALRQVAVSFDGWGEPLDRASMLDEVVEAALAFFVERGGHRVAEDDVTRRLGREHQLRVEAFKLASDAQTALNIRLNQPGQAGKVKSAKTAQRQERLREILGGRDIRAVLREDGTAAQALVDLYAEARKVPVDQVRLELSATEGDPPTRKMLRRDLKAL